MAGVELFIYPAIGLFAHVPHVSLKALIFSAVPVAQEAVPWPESKSQWQ